MIPQRLLMTRSDCKKHADLLGGQINQDLVYKFALSELSHLGPVKQVKLVECFSSARNVFAASPQELARTGLVNPEDVQQITTVRDFTGHLKKLDALRDLGINIVDYQDSKYPQRLLQIVSFPPVLFCRGDIGLLNRNRLLAVVGSRGMTEYGKRVLREFIPRLVENQIVVVSGMAMGVDACAHLECLHHNGQTVAVQAQGVERGYPAINHHVYSQILEKGGCVISEFSGLHEVEGGKFLFPRRNRLMSGMSDAVLVVEAEQKSGSLITARFAVEQNRDVFAVPGGIFQKQSQGCLELIKQGAGAVSSVEDILESMGMTSSQKPKSSASLPIDHRVATDHLATPLEKAIALICEATPRSMDEIVNEVQEPASFVTATITRMQLLGKLQEVEGHRFVLVH